MVIQKKLICFPCSKIILVRSNPKIIDSEGMMAINIFLAIFGLIGTLSAFGGRTWNDGAEPLMERITKRGWLSLSCLIVAFSLGVAKEIKTYKISQQKDKENNELSMELTSLKDSLNVVRGQLIDASSKIHETGIKIDQSVSSFGEQSVLQLEEAFKLAVDIPIEYDDWVITLNGAPVTKIPGRKTNPMELYWGDIFEYTFIDDGYSDEPELLESVKLRIANEEYDLHNGGASVFEHGEIRIYGNTPHAMTGEILNPYELENIKIKIFVRSTDASRGQEEFKKLILNSQFSEIGKRLYKVVNTNILRLRAEPNSNSQIRSTLKKGSFVRVLHEQDGWYEITTPKNRQGWVNKDFITEIK